MHYTHQKGEELMATFSPYMGEGYPVSVWLATKGISGVKSVEVYRNLERMENQYVAHMADGAHVGPLPTKEALFVALRMLQS